jgi:ribosome-associated protein
MDVKITTDFIRLDSLLKLSDVCASGGEAKVLIQGGGVTLNFVLCTERGKKIRENDVVTALGKTLRVVK